MYKNYATDLEARADDLLRNGLNVSSRRGMMAMKARYSKEIIPIEQAFKRREELAKEQRNNADKTMFYQRDARTMSLDDFINDPALDYGQSFSGAMLAKMTGDMATNLKTAMTDRSKLKGIGLPFQYEQLIQYGYTPEQIRFAIENPNSEKAVPVLNTIVQQALDSSGMASWATPAQMAQARAYATQGLYNAIGQTTIKDYKDEAGLIKYKADLDDRNNARAHARAAAAQQAQERRNNRLSPLALREQAEVTAANKQIEDYIRQGYLMRKDGKVVLTKKGLTEYYKTTDEYRTEVRNGVPGMAPSVSRVPTGRKVGSAFKAWADKIGAGKHAYSNGKQGITTGFNDAVNAHIAANKPGSYDTYHTTEYDRQLDSSYGEDFMRQVKSAASNNRLSVVEFKGRQWKETKTIKTADLAGYVVTNVRYSKYGNTAILQKKDGSGDPIRVKIPAGMHLGAEANVSIAISAADDYGHILSTGKRPKTATNSAGQLVISKDKSGNIIYSSDPLTDADRQVFLELQDEALSDMGSYGSQLVVPSKTKDEEYQPFNF